LAGQPRGTQRYQPTQRHDEDRLTQAILTLASQYYNTVRSHSSLGYVRWRRIRTAAAA
jgi:hypothetical protein